MVWDAGRAAVRSVIRQTGALFKIENECLNLQNSISYALPVYSPRADPLLRLLPLHQRPVRTGRPLGPPTGGAAEHYQRLPRRKLHRYREPGG